MKGQFPFIKANGKTPRERRERVDSNDLYEEVLTQAAVQARRYLRTIRERHVGVLPEAIEGLSALGGPLPARGENPLAILKLLDDAGSPATVASMGGRFFGGVIGGALPASVAAHWLADAWDQNACLYDISPVAAHMEDVVLSWILDLLGLPPNCGGAFVTGTQMADVTALAAARSSVLRNTGWDVERDGLFSAPPVSNRRRGGSCDDAQSLGTARVRKGQCAYCSR
jgi:aromatic-L-amino-acid decarboxylase